MSARCGRTKYVVHASIDLSMPTIKRLGSSGIIIIGLSLLAGSLINARVPVVAGGASGTVTDRDDGSSSRNTQESIERYLEIAEIQGTVTVETGALKQQGRAAKVGDRLRAPGEGVATGSNSSAKLRADSGIGTIDVAENSNLQVKSLRTLRNGAKTTDLATNRGRNRVRVRSFRNPASRFTIQTPTGIAGVRGTDFTVIVAPSGETRVFTASGEVEVTAQFQTRRLTDGSYTVIAPGKPPTEAGSFSSSLLVSLQLLPAPDEGKVRLKGKVNPINSVFLDNQAIDLSPTGEFELIATIAPSRRLTLVVRTPLGDEQVYELVIPQSVEE